MPREYIVKNPYNHPPHPHHPAKLPSQTQTTGLQTASKKILKKLLCVHRQDMSMFPQVTPLQQLQNTIFGEFG